MFLDEIERISGIVKSLIKIKQVKVVSQFDADGITSASIIARALVREDVNFELRIVKQLTSDVVESLNVNKDNFLIISDCGSGQIESLEPILGKTQILILDHHEPQKFSHSNLFHVNPLLFGEDETSSSIICYLFAKSLNVKNTDLVDLAIIGAIGDIQDENWEFKGLAKKILEEAESIGKISLTKGLRLYGRQTRPLHRSLAYSFDPFIPGISGSESNAVQFLLDIGINVKDGGDWKKLKDLTIEEQQKLATAIIRERLHTEEAENIFGDVYTILGRPEELQDAREMATMINACGRTKNANVGLRLCLGDYTALKRSSEVIDDYRRLLSDCLNWIRENKDSVLSTDFGNYILGKNKIPDTVIGTVTSLILNSNLFSEKPTFGFADAGDRVKVSGRIPRFMKLNLRDIFVNAVMNIGYEAGGHSKAAGAIIPKGKEHEFIKIVDSLMGDMIGSKKS